MVTAAGQLLMGENGYGFILLGLFCLSGLRKSSVVAMCRDGACGLGDRWGLGVYLGCR